MTQESVNPFRELIVKDPRRRESVVAGLNARPLQKLLSQFDRLSAGSAPRPQHSADTALLVTSEQPGYGKSHLIGRLFTELQGRATLVYVLPFQNAATAFQSLMLAITREMHLADRTQLSPLDVLAHAVLAHLLADLVEADGILQIDTPPESAGILRKDPLGAFLRGDDPWAQWLEEHWQTLEPFFEEALARRGLTLSAPASWLRVLRAYAFAPRNAGLRRACLDWLSGQPGAADDVSQMGVRLADAIHTEITPEAANAWCRLRVVELCQLAAFFRPFVFCFDQTEVYGHQPELARAFGMLIATLVSEAPNHLTLITANQEPWLERIVPSIEKADMERITRPPLTLEGLDRAQAAELARLRMEAAATEPDRMAAFLDSRWLEKLFPTPRNQMGTRVFLQHCKERWERQPARPVPLVELYQQRREKLLASPKRHDFEPDTLQWLVEEGARGVAGMKINKLPSDEYFNVRWKTDERTCLFGFTAGSNWSQWRTIARVALKKNKKNPSPPVKAVFFRAPGQPPIPGLDWNVRDEIEEAKATALHIIALSVEELCELYAARELYADAVQGDIAYNTEQVIAFLGEHLMPWWVRLRGPVDAVAAGVIR